MPDWWVALASFAFCAFSALAFGLGPAWRLSRLDLLPEMRSPEGTGAGAVLRRFGTSRLLIAGRDVGLAYSQTLGLLLLGRPRLAARLAPS